MEKYTVREKDDLWVVERDGITISLYSSPDLAGGVAGLLNAAYVSGLAAGRAEIAAEAAQNSKDSARGYTAIVRDLLARVERLEAVPRPAPDDDTAKRLRIAEAQVDAAKRMIRSINDLVSNTPNQTARFAMLSVTGDIAMAIDAARDSEATNP